MPLVTGLEIGVPLQIVGKEAHGKFQRDEQGTVGQKLQFPFGESAFTTLQKAFGKCLKEAGVTSGYDSTTESALGKLFYLLGQVNDPAAVKSYMESDLRGEISK